MAKKIIITKCSECPNLDYFVGNYYCIHDKYYIARTPNGIISNSPVIADINTIPSWCPLEDENV